MVFALIEPLLPGRRFGTQFVPSTETIALNKYARTFWRVFLIINICCFVAEMIGVAWFYGEVPLKYSLIAPAVILVLIGVIWKSLKMASDSSRLQVK
jgi:hypothetical protein